MTEVKAIECPNCKDIIFSRANHDFRSCSCKAVSIDGGFECKKVSWDTNFPLPKEITLTINQTKKELYDDWNLYKDKFGLIKYKE